MSQRHTMNFPRRSRLALSWPSRLALSCNAGLALSWNAGLALRLLLAAALLSHAGLLAQSFMTLTGTVQSAPIAGSFILTLSPGRSVRVLGAQARYISQGKPASIAWLHPGARVTVKGSYAYNQMTAAEVYILSAPGARAVAAPRPGLAPRPLAARSPFPRPASQAFHPAFQHPAASPGLMTLSGAVRALRPGYLLLAPAGRAALWVHTFGARTLLNGRPVFGPAAAPRLGASITVQGRMSGIYFQAATILLSPAPNTRSASVQRSYASAYSRPPLQKPARAAAPGILRKPVANPALTFWKIAPLHLQAVHSLSDFQRQQTLLSGRLTTLQNMQANWQHMHPFHSNASPRPYLPPAKICANCIIQASNAVSGPPTLIAPVASMFASGDGYANLEYDSAPAQSVAFASFFSDPPAGWSGATQLVGGNLAWSSPSPLPTTSPLAAASQGVFFAANSAQVVMVLPCYFDPGSGGVSMQAANFEARVQTQDPISGQWQTVSDNMLVMDPSGQPTSNTQTSAITTVVNQLSYPWRIALNLKQVVTIVRLEVYISLYGSNQAMNTSSNRGQSSPTPASIEWTFPSYQSAQAVNGVPTCTNIQPSTTQQSQASTCLVTDDSQAGHQWYASPAFQIALAPTGLLQPNVLPFTIVYFPPGNNAQVTLSSISGYSSQLGFSLSGQNATQIANTQGSAFTTNQGLSYAGVSLSQSNTVGTSQEQITGQSTSNGLTESITASETIKDGHTYSSYPQCGHGNPPPNDAQSPFDEPYWCDSIVFLMHPVLAVWQYANPDFNATQLIRYTPASVVTSHYRMNALYHCAYGGSIYPVPGAQSDSSSYPNLQPGGSMTLADGTVLSAAECASMVQLDPYFATHWQGVPLDPGRFQLVDSIPPGDGNETIDDQKLQADSQGTQTSSAQLTGSGQGTSSSSQTSLSISSPFKLLGQSGSVQAGVSQSQSSSTMQTEKLTVTYGESQSQTLTNGMEVQAKLNDSGIIPPNPNPSANNYCSSAPPPSVWLANGQPEHSQCIYIYRDLQFGGLAFQDANEVPVLKPMEQKQGYHASIPAYVPHRR